MQLLAIGVDIEKVSRFVKFSQKKDKKLLMKIFTPNELIYCFSNKNPAKHLTARFCAKEATVKALSSAGFKFPLLNKIEVILSDDGIPSLLILDTHFSAFKFLLSLSHTVSDSIAFVVITK